MLFLRLCQLGPAFPDKSILKPHNREYSEPEQSGSCTGGSEDRREEFFTRTWELFQESLHVTLQIGTDLSNVSVTLSMFSGVHTVF